ncbi:DegT/DnrJ/EryC1/StrS family aminotransferase [Candidatus Pelagibacter sp.]|nr:DegT/DnrJ/EryC1/StrS family aminotransferase [Candidatus Pelagibacter sp.]
MKINLLEPKINVKGSNQKLVDWIDPQPKKNKKINGIIRVCEPTLGKEEKKNVLDCMNTGWISSHGKYIKKFEELFAKKCNAKYAVATSSGSTAIHLACHLLGLKKNDEIIMPTISMVATANMVAVTGAKPVFVDIDQRTWTIDVDQIEKKITKKTKAIMPVHIYGHPCNMDQIKKIAKKYKLLVIEDAAEAHGAIYKNKKVGSIGDITIFSFFANKNITSGEGGMLTTNNQKIYKLALQLRNQAFSKERHFWHKYSGFNYRMTNLQAAIGYAQTKKMDNLVKKRIKNAKYYNSKLKSVNGIILPPATKNVLNVYWMYTIIVNEKFYGMNSIKLRTKLAEKGVETRSFFIPLHLQPIFYEKKYKNKFPISESIFKNAFYLPSSSHLTKKQKDYIINIIKVNSKRH